jgi:hypothetical protein
VLLHGKSTVPTRESLARMVVAGGGTVVARTPPVPGELQLEGETGPHVAVVAEEGAAAGDR